MRYVIISNGDILDYNIIKEYLENSNIICCDGGLRHCYAMGIKPNCVVGDFDSVNPEHMIYYKEQGVEFKEYPMKKDTTDTEIAVGLAVDNVADEIYMFGVTGTRLDHTLANIQLLIMCMNHGVKAKIIDDYNIIEITKGNMVINGNAGDIVSIVPLTAEVNGISNEGLEYHLDNYSVKLGVNCGRGISNVMVSNRASVSIKDGVLLVIKARD